MSIVKIEQFGGKGLDRATKLLAGMSGGIERAIKSAFPRAVSYLRSHSGYRIRERYAISQSALRTNENVKIKYSYQNGATAEIIFNGQKIPLYRYNGSSPKQPTFNKGRSINAILTGGWRTVHPGVSALGHLLNGTAPVRFNNAFTANMKSGHIGIFERTGGVSSSGADAIREIMGLSVPQMLGNQEVAEKLSEDASKKFEERLEHEISRLLSGIGG